MQKHAPSVSASETWVGSVVSLGDYSDYGPSYEGDYRRQGENVSDRLRCGFEMLADDEYREGDEQ